MQFDNQKTRNVADVVANILAGESAEKVKQPEMLEEALKGDQHKIDANKNKKIDAHDFKLLRAQKDKEKANSQKFGKDVKEETEQIDELSKTTLNNYLKGVKRENDPRIHGDSAGSGNQMSNKARSLGRTEQDKEDGRYEGQKLAKRKLGVSGTIPAKVMAREETEQIDEYKSVDGVYKHKGTYGTEKSTEAGYTDYEKENELAKKHLKAKTPKKYGARQNYIRSTRVNESFTSLLNIYKEHGVKGLAEALVKEEPDNEEFTKEMQDQKAKMDGKKKGADVAKASVQAVKVEETEIQVINADIANGVEQIDIEERSLTEPEMKKREEIVKSMKKGMAGFKQRYGDRAKEVMYATATARAKGE